MEGHALGFDEDSRRIVVSVDGVTIADSSATIGMLETGLPVRHYFPRADVQMDLLGATTTETVCPFKGQASYWTVQVGDTEHRDLAWSYEQPIAGAERIKDRLCFYDERVDITIDGEAQERPETPWSRSA